MTNMPPRLQVGFSTTQRQLQAAPCSREQWSQPDMSRFSDPQSPVFLRSSASVPHTVGARKQRTNMREHLNCMLRYAYRRPNFITQRIRRSIKQVSPVSPDHETCVADYIVQFSDNIIIGLRAVPYDKSMLKRHSVISVEGKLMVVKVHVDMEQDHTKCLISMLGQLAQLSEFIFGERLPRHKKPRQNGEMPSTFRKMKKHHPHFAH